jgi:hypothetical protein
MSLTGEWVAPDFENSIFYHGKMAERCLVGIHKKQVGGEVGCSWSFLLYPI